MIYLMSSELCLMSYLMSYVILSSYDLTALVYVLLLGLRLTISRLVSMHFVLCRSLRILEDMSFLSFLRILILLEKPPHLTADYGGLVVPFSFPGSRCALTKCSVGL